MKVERLQPALLESALDDLARLRIEVFRSFPYLYDGDLDYERNYLRSYRDNPEAVIVVAREGGKVVGAATGMPFERHGDAAQMVGPLPPKDEIFYCAESVLLPQYRGRGIGHAFFDAREAAAREGGFKFSLFCSVIRPEDHPARPLDYRPHDAFWRKRGYAPAEGVIATFHWQDLGETEETSHRLQGWMRQL